MTSISLKFSRFFLVALAALVAAQAAQATTYYISPNGNDGYPGTSVQYPFQSWWQANQHLHAGDRLEIMPGSYSNLGINVSGTTAAPIVYIAQKPGNPPVINGASTYPAIWIQANNIRISGVVVTTGQNSPAPGLMVFQSNHIEVDHVTAHDSGGGGLMSVYSDYIRFWHNVVYNNSYANPDQTSGISIGFGVNSDTAPGVHNVIAGNVSYDNCDRAAYPGTNYTTDGNGIIVDTMNATQFVGTTAVYNNLVYGNGGSGIRVFNSNNVFVTNNTSVGNEQSATVNGGKAEIANEFGIGNHYRNNIAVAANSDTYALLDTDSSGSLFDYNLTSGGAAAQTYSWASNTVWGSHNQLGKNPQFASGTMFQVAAGSPVLGHADGSVAPGIDIRGDARPTNRIGIDLGAYQQSR